MPAIITRVLNAIAVLLFKPTRGFATHKLKDGDLTDEKFLRLVVRELDDIKRKLDGLARKDLLTSVNFLEDAVSELILFLDQSANDNENRQTTWQAIQAEAVLNNAASLAHRQNIADSLKILSQDRFTTAKSRFERAYEKATEAFNDKALSLEDRILAAELRVASRLLKGLEDPEAAATSCKLYVEALVKMPAINKMLLVHVNGGVKALFNKTKRLENVKSVITLSVVFLSFAKTFTTLTFSPFNRPVIQFGKRIYRLCFEEIQILEEIHKAGVKTDVLYGITVKTANKDFCPWCSAVSSRGEIITKSRMNPGVLKVIDSTGEVQAVCSLPEEDTQARGFEILSLAIDSDDSVCVVTVFEEPEDVYNYKIFWYDNKFNIKKQLSLGFLTGRFGWVSIAVSKDKKIVIRKYCEDRMYVCGSDGNLLYSIDVNGRFDFKTSLSISDRNELIVVPDYSNTVHFRTERGELKRCVRLPEHHVALGVAFHHVTKTVVVYTRHEVEYSYHLLSYSETGEVQTLSIFHDADCFAKLTSHPSGPVALVHWKGVIYF